MSGTYSGSKASVELGSSVSIGPLASATGSPTYTAIAEITDIDFSGMKVATVDVTNMSSTAHEKVGTLPDYGSIKVSANRVSNDPGQLAMVAAFATGGTYLFQVQEPVNAKIGQSTTGNLYAFSAIVTEGPSFSLTPDKPAVVTFTVEVTGAITFTAGA